MFCATSTDHPYPDFPDLLMNRGYECGVFDREKARVLDKADLSRKGSVDAPIRHLVEAINAHPHYYTTSSCSGRSVVLCEVHTCVIMGGEGALLSLITYCALLYIRRKANGRRVAIGYSFLMIQLLLKTW